MKLSANISWLFKEEPCLLKRLKLAKKHGFNYVELASPYEYSTEEFSNAVSEAQVKVTLINTARGSQPGDRGLASGRSLFMTVFDKRIRNL